jgi:hypothetical protein
MTKWCKHEFELLTGTDIGLAAVKCNKCGDQYGVYDLMKWSATDLMRVPKPIRLEVLKRQAELFNKDNPFYYQAEPDSIEVRLANHIMYFGKLNEPQDCLTLAHELITEVINPAFQEVASQLEARITELDKLLHHVHDGLNLQALTSKPIFPKAKTDETSIYKAKDVDM